ncbi:MAG: hypothetical protein GF353_29590 [Candidatus Lokiarchaeota archaeon]|nr:hypothetical protein [Candidatus Lokiarchaeota archaeon]
MAKEHVFVCNRATYNKTNYENNFIQLISRKNDPERNVYLEIENISDCVTANISNLMIDLLEIASLVYAADQVAKRGSKKDIGEGKYWRRELRFIIPVREYKIWKQKEVLLALEEVLGFLSEDDYTFEFQQQKEESGISQYLDFGSGGCSGFEAEELVLFSGGLDSLGGAIQEIVVNEAKTLLVSHRSSKKTDPRQQKIVKLLEGYIPNGNFLHIPVWVNKDSKITKEDTQRTRSFLFISLASAVASVFNLNRIRIYENGITSINLTNIEHMIGARASRTTNPKVLKGFEKLLNIITEKKIEVENPFIWKTKAEIVNLIGDRHLGIIMKQAISCSRTMASSNKHPHCGRCFQCVSRRFATLASEYPDYDPPELYEKELLIDPITPGEQMTLMESYVRTYKEISKMSPYQFYSEFGEPTQVLSYVDTNIDKAAENVFKLYKKHAKEVKKVLHSGMKKYYEDILEEKIPESSLLILSLPDKYKEKKRVEADFRHSMDFRSVNYKGKLHTFTERQAHVVQMLYEEFINGTPELGVQTILVNLDSPNSRLQDTFRDHEAWGELIIPGDKKGTVRLNI